MRAGLRITAMVLAALLFSLSAFLFRRAPDPVFEGRLASEWINDLLSSDHQVRSEAQLALQVFGEPVVPQLRLMLRKSNGPWEKPLVRLTVWAPFLNYRVLDAVLCRQRAAEMVGLLRGKARAALPDLVSSLAMDGCAADAERAFLRCGKIALPILERALENRNPAIRGRAAKLLGEMRDVEPSTALALIQRAADHDPAVRRRIAQTLGEIKSAADPLPALLVLARDAESEVRAAAMEALGRRASLPETLAALKNGLSDSSPRVRLHASKSLWAQEKDPNVLPVLIGLLTTGESYQAAYVLADLGEVATPAVPSLIDGLRRERVPRPFRTPPSCAFALGQIGPAALEPLGELLAAEETQMRMNAVLAVGFMERRGKSAIPMLLPLLEDRDAEVRHATALTLAAIGAEPNQVLAGLSACLTAEDIYMRSAAAHILREIAPNENWVVQPE